MWIVLFADYSCHQRADMSWSFFFWFTVYTKCCKYVKYFHSKTINIEQSFSMTWSLVLINVRSVFPEFILVWIFFFEPWKNGRECVCVCEWVCVCVWKWSICIWNFVKFKSSCWHLRTLRGGFPLKGTMNMLKHFCVCVCVCLLDNGLKWRLFHQEPRIVHKYFKTKPSLWKCLFVPLLACLFVEVWLKWWWCSWNM